MRLQLTCALALVAATCTCSPPAPKAPAFSLLHRMPDAVLDQPGELVPDEEHGWHEFGLLGWERSTRGDPDRGPHVWTSQPEALLRLPAVSPRDRVLELSAWRGEHEEAAEEVTLTLNGLPLGTHPLSDQQTSLRLPVPESVWLRGDNVLALSVERMHPGPWNPRGFAVGRVRYDDAKRVDLAAKQGALTLSSGTGVRYAIETPQTASLVMKGRAPGSGSLELTFWSAEPATGTPSSLGDPLTLAIAGGPFDLAAPLPVSRPDAIHSVDVAWLAHRDGVELVLDELRIAEAAPIARPPILFLSIDTLAARSMSLYGYGRPTTPALERWAREEAVDFRACKANAPWTVPSYLSQMTGLFPHANRIPQSDLRSARSVEGHSVAIWEMYQLAPNRWTLAEQLRAAGYRTGAIIDNMWLGRIPGFEQGFDHYDDGPSRVAIRDTEGGMRLVFPRALEWLRDSPSMPFFLFLQILDCHGPYLPTAPWRGTFDDEDGIRQPDHVAPTVDYSSPPTFGTIPEYVAESLIDPDDELPESMMTAPLIRAYDEKVYEVDAVVSEFLSDLRALPFYDDALIVISADHGESMIEHEHLFRHGTIYEETVHVPLLVKLPGGASAGTRVEDPVQLVDLFATLADYAGAPPREHLHGRSLRPLLEGALLEPQPVVCQGNIMAQTSIELDGWKMIRSDPEQGSIRTILTHTAIAAEIQAGLFGNENSFRAPITLFSAASARAFEQANRELVDAIKLFLRQRGLRYELYDLASDPAESTDRSAEHPDRVAQLEERLREIDERTAAARSTASFSAETIELDEENRQELQNLGYIDDD